MSHFSFSLALVCIYSSLYEKVHVVWIKIHIQCKSFSLNINNKFEIVVGSAVLVTLKVVPSQPKFSFSVLALLFRLQNSSKLKLFCENYLDGKNV